MGFQDLLIDLCDILRYTSTPDDYGQPIKSWAVHLTGQPCRLSTPKNLEIKKELEVVVADKILFLEDSVDVTERDRVEINSITYEILSVSSYRGNEVDSKQLLLRTLR